MTHNFSLEILFTQIMRLVFWQLFDNFDSQKVSSKMVIISFFLLDNPIFLGVLVVSPIEYPFYELVTQPIINIIKTKLWIYYVLFLREQWSI